ncbi:MULTISPECIES: beta/alpha barrel domain-containing protein [Streptomyces]|uniref:4-hydroxy-2-oxovalerate aldolase n=2 Tax=Streptomyces TaxID=1883 RepID=A0A1D8G5G8_9ACTN|nr:MULTISPECIES: hypothetical protein [Streptomyces]AOT60663.1 4-hydroxy-2-oxovalerate aldolase [Streptomyces rubrolavendulae]KAF0647315.1 hypothetical protein K701_24185 [Streptomyces fradiae ATCC 10745 = DSM 40063]OSY52550.1 4-hydroxy-2-oxovalerate aldolase [Streptomyces fradiae ATCC 10745 = DSM 40063]QEV13759.1 hypothetical protein CP974_19185 [Streptomyces fradiae ATCC 10745 = DSM 40063]UQS30998.1 hypothetical protein J5J01_04620 [Streptomyces fradiae]
MTGPDRSRLTVLDCTLRDGGYYTDWYFDGTLVEDYLAACASAGVDVVELGYAQLAETDRGPYGRLPDGLPPGLAATLAGHPSLRYAVMVDAARLTGEPDPGPRLAERLAAASLPVELVRVAVHSHRTAAAADLVASLRDAGFGVCLNLMQIDLLDDARIGELVGTVAGMGPLTAVYVADSLGSMRAGRVADLIGRFTAGQTAPVGVHAHDNQGFALHNTLAAAGAGATWLDATVLGMGRGAGNTRTEQLLAALGADADRLASLLETTARHLLPLHDKHRWGAGPLYALAGMHGVHPSYVQRLEQAQAHGLDGKLRALRALAAAGASTFSEGALADALGHG